MRRLKRIAEDAERKSAVFVSAPTTPAFFAVKTVRAIPKSLWMILAVGGTLAALLILYFFAPMQYAFYPRCLFYTLTGLSCPGCGSLRAMHHLLHGHWTAAFHCNPLLIVLLPILPGAFISHLLHAATGRDMFAVFKRPFWIWLLLGVMVAFSILRNLPFEPLAEFRL